MPAELANQSLEEVRFMIDVNLMGSFNVIKAALNRMKGRADRRPASIALMSSQTGQVSICGLYRVSSARHEYCNSLRTYCRRKMRFTGDIYCACNIAFNGIPIRLILNASMI